LRAPFLEPRGCGFPCIFLFFLQNEKDAARGRATKNPARGIPPGPSGAISVNTLFWKILVTRVNREMGSAMGAEAQYLQEIATTPP
jgi:hypothetical protein